MKSIALPTLPADSAPIVKSGGWSQYTPYVSICFVVVAVLTLVLGRASPMVHTLSIVFVSIVLEAMPFVLLGAIVGGIIEVYLPREKVSEWLPKNTVLQVLMAGAMGVIFPVCECAVIPVARRLMKKGVPFSAAAAYLLAGPIVNPLVAASTGVAYLGDDWKRMILVRMVSGYIVAVIVAFILGKCFPGSTAFHEPEGPADDHDHDHDHAHSHDEHAHTHDHVDPKAKVCTDPTHDHSHDHAHAHAEHDHAAHADAHDHAHDHDHDHGHDDHNHAHSDHSHDDHDHDHHDHDHAHHDHDHDHAPPKKARAIARIASVFSHASDDFLFVGQFLVIGAFIAALCTTLLQRQVLVEFSHTPAIGIGSMMVMAVFLSICSEADAFVAASFHGAMPFAAQMAFMVLGPMLDFKLIAMYLSFMRKPAVGMLIGLIFLTVFILMMVVYGLHILPDPPPVAHPF